MAEARRLVHTKSEPMCLSDAYQLQGEGEKRTMIVWEVWAQEGLETQENKLESAIAWEVWAQESLETQENKVESAIAWEVIWENLAYQLQCEGEEKQIIIIWENLAYKLQGEGEEKRIVTMLAYFIKFLRMPVWRSQRPRLLLLGAEDMPHREILIRKIATILQMTRNKVEAEAKDNRGKDFRDRVLLREG